jgi:glutathione S-transferase
MIWDTLAIIERVHELAPEARIVAATIRCGAFDCPLRGREMHSGFQGLRAACPVNIRARKAGHKGRGEAVDKDVAPDHRRLAHVPCERFGADGPFLFGEVLCR